MYSNLIMSFVVIIFLFKLIIARYKNCPFYLAFTPSFCFKHGKFIKASLSRTTLSSISCNCHLDNSNLESIFAHSQVKRHGKVSFWIYVFSKKFSSTPYSQAYFQYLLHQYASNIFSINLK